MTATCTQGYRLAVRELNLYWIHSSRFWMFLFYCLLEMHQLFECWIELKGKLKDKFARTKICSKIFEGREKLLLVFDTDIFNVVT